MGELGDRSIYHLQIELSSACGWRPDGRYALDALDFVVSVELVAMGYFEARSGTAACDWCKCSTRFTLPRVSGRTVTASSSGHEEKY